MQKRKEYRRLRLDSGQHRRIRIVAAFLGLLAFVPVGLRLYQLMVTDYEYYANLALRNQTRSTGVTADRGIIYDRNMNILACNQSVENVYLDPHELRQAKADIPAISAVLGEILELDPNWIAQQAADTKMRYKQIAARVSEDVASRIRGYIKTSLKKALNKGHKKEKLVRKTYGDISKKMDESHKQNRNRKTYVESIWR